MSGLRPLDRVDPGMELAHEVRNAQGMHLLPAGTRLTERHLTMLRAWGVTQIPIAGPNLPAGAGSAAPGRRLPADLERELRDMFGAAAADPRMAEILRVALHLRSAPPGPEAPPA